MFTCMSWTVYRHITPNGKSYIGITCRKPERRWRNGKGYDIKTPFGKAIEKYKWENIKHEILDTNITEDEAKRLEKEYIEKYRTFVRFHDCNGYNLTLGGEGTVGFPSWNKGKHNSEEHNRKISESKKGQTTWNKGIPMDDETKRKIGESNKGRKHTEEEKKKISEAGKGRPAWNKDKQMNEEFKSKISASLIGNQRNKGKNHSEEHNRKIGESKKGKHWKLIDGKRVWY